MDQITPTPQHWMCITSTRKGGSGHSGTVYGTQKNVQTKYYTHDQRAGDASHPVLWSGSGLVQETRLGSLHATIIGCGH